MELSKTEKVKYKLNTKGMNITQMAKLLRKHSIKGFLIRLSERFIVVIVPRDEITLNKIKMKQMIKVMEG